MLIYVIRYSKTKPIGDGPRNSEPWTIYEDDASACTLSPKLYITPKEELEASTYLRCISPSARRAHSNIRVRIHDTSATSPLT
ncbi:hypothetical protein TNCV_352191 [Trichonephila clavipes]|nr:hypothetical protein TNCV_352191 [Trichonephila clavipes]